MMYCKLLILYTVFSTFLFNSVYATEVPSASWQDDHSQSFTIALTGTNCVYPSDDVEALQKSEMPKDEKEKVIERILEPFIKCVQDETSDEQKKMFEESLLYTIFKQGEEIKEKSNQIISLQEDNDWKTNLSIGLGVVSIVGTFIGTYVGYHVGKRKTK